MSDGQTSDVRQTVFPKVRGGAFGARVLSFVCFAPNDGFCPQSGLVQRVVCMLPVGSGSGRLYIMKGAMMIKPYNRPAGEGKQANLAALVEMHPYSPTGTSPGGGSLLSAQLLAS